MEYVVSGLVDFDDVADDSHADLLYDLAAQTVKHFRTNLSEEDTREVLRLRGREIVRFIHAQMRVTTGKKSQAVKQWTAKASPN